MAMVVPWYERSRAMILVRPISPRAAKCCRAIFSAESMPSEPPQVKWM